MFFAACAIVGLLHSRAGALDNSWAATFKQVRSSVVTIRAGIMSGTGFFVRDANHVVTCNHVVSEAKSIYVEDRAGHRFPVKRVAYDWQNDLAILELGGRPIAAPLPISDAAYPPVGTDVALIGTPLGFLEQTLTTGIVSALRRMDDTVLVQTNAAASEGSSGSPLVTRAGKVVGVLSFKFKRGDGVAMCVFAKHIRTLLAANRFGPISPDPFAAEFGPLPSPWQVPKKENPPKPQPEPPNDKRGAYNRAAAELHALLFMSYCKLQLQVKGVEPIDVDFDSGIGAEILDAESQFCRFSVENGVPLDNVRAKIFDFRIACGRLRDAGSDYLSAKSKLDAALSSGRSDEAVAGLRAQQGDVLAKAKAARGCLARVFLSFDTTLYDISLYAAAADVFEFASILELSRDRLLPDPRSPHICSIGWTAEGEQLHRGDVISFVDNQPVKTWRDFFTVAMGKSQVLVTTKRGASCVIQLRA